MRIGAETAAVERGQDAVLAAELGVMNGRVRLVAIDMQRAAAFQIEEREGMDVLVVAAATTQFVAVSLVVL